MRGLSRKTFGNGTTKGNKTPFLYVKHKEKMLYKNRNLCYYICVPGRERQKTKGGFYYDNFQHFLL